MKVNKLKLLWNNKTYIVIYFLLFSIYSYSVDSSTERFINKSIKREIINLDLKGNITVIKVENVLLENMYYIISKKDVFYFTLIEVENKMQLSRNFKFKDSKYSKFVLDYMNKNDLSKYFNSSSCLDGYTVTICDWRKKCILKLLNTTVLGELDCAL